jgi:fatty-acyl-CoA synthase
MTVDIGLGNWLYRRALRTPHRKALTFEGTTWTYGELQDRIDRLASALRAHGVCRGDRVGFLGFNQPSFLETLFAAARLGAIFVPLNFRLSGPELSYIINNAGVHTLITDASHQPVIDSVRTELPCRRYLSADQPAEGWSDIAGLLAVHDPLRTGERVGDDEIAIIMFTSGTTGRPKGAMLTHGNIWWNNINVLLAYDVLADDVSLLVAPLFHIGGLNVNSLVIWQKGGHIVLHRSFDPRRCLDDVATYRVSTMFAVPAMLLFISQQPTFASADLSSLRTIVCGGAPVPEPLMRLYADRGIPINQGYGLTETSPFVTFLSPEWGMTKLGSAGRAPIFSDMRLIDPNGRDIATPCEWGGHHQRAEYNERILEQYRSDGRGDRLRGLVSHRRCRLFRRGRFSVHRRPPEGYGDYWRRERLPGRGRERAVRPSRHHRNRGDRPARRAMG